MTQKRNDYLSWEQYFVSIAYLSAQRSKDPSTQVGACIVDPNNVIVGIGYNGFPKGCSDDVFPWARKSENYVDEKYAYVCHAELNAVLNKNSASVKDCTIYCTLFPCDGCAKVIIQSGIKKVVYVEDKYHNEPSTVASRKMLDAAGVVYEQYQKQGREITISL